MSADNWAVCPRCLHEAGQRLEALQEHVRAQYGKVPMEEWDEISTALTEEVDEEKYQTFREDYEIFGAETGVLQIRYKGRCTFCGLGTEVKEQRQFWIVDDNKGST